jgi:hypothetical protein
MYPIRKWTPWFWEENAQGFKRRRPWRPEAAAYAHDTISRHVKLEADKIDCDKARAVGLDRLIIESERDGAPTRLVVCNEKVGERYVVVPKASACVRSGEQTVAVIRKAWHRFCEAETDEAMEEVCAVGQAEFADLRLDIDDLLTDDGFTRRPIDEHLCEAIAYVEGLKKSAPLAVKENG